MNTLLCLLKATVEELDKRLSRMAGAMAPVTRTVDELLTRVKALEDKVNCDCKEHRLCGTKCPVHG